MFGVSSRNSLPVEQLSMKEIGAGLKSPVDFTGNSPDNLVKPGSLQPKSDYRGKFQVSQQEVNERVPEGLRTPFLAGRKALQEGQTTQQRANVLQRFFRQGTPAKMGEASLTRESTWDEVSEKTATLQSGDKALGGLKLAGRQSWFTRAIRWLFQKFGVLTAPEKRANTISESIPDFKAQLKKNLAGLSESERRDAIGSLAHSSIEEVKTLLKEAMPGDPDFQNNDAFLERIATEVHTAMIDASLETFDQVNSAKLGEAQNRIRGFLEQPDPAIKDMVDLMEQTQKTVWNFSESNISDYGVDAFHQHDQKVRDGRGDVSLCREILNHPLQAKAKLDDRIQLLREGVGVHHFYDPHDMVSDNERAREVLEREKQARENDQPLPPRDPGTKRIMEKIDRMAREVRPSGGLNAKDPDSVLTDEEMEKLVNSHQKDLDRFEQSIDHKMERLERLEQIREKLYPGDDHSHWGVAHLPDSQRKALNESLDRLDGELNRLEGSRRRVMSEIFGDSTVEETVNNVTFLSAGERARSPIGKLASGLAKIGNLNAPSQKPEDPYTSEQQSQRARPLELQNEYDPVHSVESHFDDLQRDLNFAKQSLVRLAGEGKIAEVHWDFASGMMKELDETLGHHREAHRAIAKIEVALRDTSSRGELLGLKTQLEEARSKLSTVKTPNLKSAQYAEIEEARLATLEQLEAMIVEVNARVEVTTQLDGMEERPGALSQQISEGTLSLSQAFEKLDQTHTSLKPQIETAESKRPRRQDVWKGLSPFGNSRRPDLQERSDQLLIQGKTTLMANFLQVDGKAGREAARTLAELKLLDAGILHDLAKLLPEGDATERGEALAELLNGVSSDLQSNALETVENFASKIYAGSDQASSEKALALKLRLVDSERRDLVHTRHIAPGIHQQLQEVLELETFQNACKAFELPVPTEPGEVLKTLGTMLEKNPEAFGDQVSAESIRKLLGHYGNMVEGKSLAPIERSELQSLVSTLHDLEASMVIEDQTRVETLMQKYASQLGGDELGKLDIDQLDTRQKVQVAMGSLENKKGMPEVQKKIGVTARRLEEVQEGVRMLDNLIDPAVERLRDHFNLAKTSDAVELLEDKSKQQAVYETAVFFNNRELRQEMEAGARIGGLDLETLRESEELSAKTVRNFDPTTLQIKERSIMQNIRTFFNKSLDDRDRINSKLTSAGAQRSVESYIAAFKHSKVRQALVENELEPLKNGLSSLRKERDSLLTEVEKHHKKMAFRMAVLEVVRDTKLPLDQFNVADHRTQIIAKIESYGVKDEDLGLQVEEFTETNPTLSRELIGKWELEDAKLPSELENRLAKLNRDLEQLVDGLNLVGSGALKKSSTQLEALRKTPYTTPKASQFGPAFNLSSRTWAKNAGIGKQAPETLTLSQALGKMQESLALDDNASLLKKNTGSAHGSLQRNLERLQNVVDDIEKARLAKLEKPGVFVDRTDLQKRLNYALGQLERLSSDLDGSDNYRSILNSMHQDSNASLGSIRETLEREIDRLV